MKGHPALLPRAYCRFVRSARSPDTVSRSLLDRSVCEVSTSELLEAVLQGLHVDRSEVDDLARAVDSGAFGAAAEMPDLLVPGRGSKDGITVVLQAVLEIARRSALPGPPPVVRGPEDVAKIAQRHIGAQI